MIKVLFVCLGNICRSPMAQFVFSQMVREKGLSDCFEINSAATESYNEIHHEGMYYGTREILKAKQCKSKRFPVGNVPPNGEFCMYCDQLFGQIE